MGGSRADINHCRRIQKYNGKSCGTVVPEVRLNKLEPVLLPSRVLAVFFFQMFCFGSRGGGGGDSGSTS